MLSVRFVERLEAHVEIKPQSLLFFQAYFGRLHVKKTIKKRDYQCESFAKGGGVLLM